MELAWSETPSSRPTFDQASKMLRRSRAGKKTIMDNMMEAMESYTAHLEEEAEAKESAMQAVRTDLDNLMLEIAPQKVVSALRSGDKIESRLYPALGIVMMEFVGFSTVLDTDAADRVLSFVDNLHQQLQQIARKYQAYCPSSQHVYTQTFVLGLEEDTNTNLLLNKCHDVARMALDILGVISVATPPWSDATSPSVRLGAHIGLVATGIMGVTAPKFLLFGQGMDTCRALLAGAEVNTVRISRSLFSQLEKSSGFIFSTKDPEWINCNGVDIEAFVMVGQHSEPVLLPSDTSVDSGIEIERPTLLIHQQDEPNDSTAGGNVQSVTKPNCGAAKHGLGRSALPAIADESYILPGHTRGTDSSTRKNWSNYRRHKSFDVQGQSDTTRHRHSEPSIEHHSLSLARISEVSEMSDIVMTHRKSNFRNSTSAVVTGGDSLHNSRRTDISCFGQPQITLDDHINRRTPIVKQQKNSFMVRSCQQSRPPSVDVPGTNGFEQINVAGSDHVMLSKYSEIILKNAAIQSEDLGTESMNPKLDINSFTYERGAGSKASSAGFRGTISQRDTSGNRVHREADDIENTTNFATFEATNERPVSKDNNLKHKPFPDRTYSRSVGNLKELDRTGIKSTARVNKIHPTS